MIMNIEPGSSSALKQQLIPFDFNNEEGLTAQYLYETLRDTMCKNNGIGLAANQIGLPYRVFVMGNPSDPDGVIGVFNPVLVDIIGEESYYEEGCLSFPGLYIKIKRPSAIRVRFTTHDGVTDTIKFDGMTARIFLHEYDHLEGKLFTERAHSLHLERAYRQKKQLDKIREKKLKAKAALK